MNPKQMQKMMQKMGMKQEEIPADQVIIISGKKKIVFDNPSVQSVDMMGQETFQLSGEYRIEDMATKADINEDDVKTVMEQTKVSEDKARKAIEDADGDLAEAIMKLSE